MCYMLEDLQWLSSLPTSNSHSHSHSHFHSGIGCGWKVAISNDATGTASDVPRPQAACARAAYEYGTGICPATTGHCGEEEEGEGSGWGR